jgi:peptide chain release factor 1
MSLDIKKYKDSEKTQYLVPGLEDLLQKERELEEIIASDPELAELSKEELVENQKQQKELVAQLDDILKQEKEEEDFPNEIVLEVRAGAGGDEAALFAKELAEMYLGYAVQKGWGTKTIAESSAGVGGYKEASFEIRGVGVYKELRFEVGVHRVQRVPATEKSGRVHTSTASVAVLPIRKKITLEVDPGEFDMEFSRSGGKGGQNVNKVESAVRIIHKPTGLDVRSTAERSQAANRERAMQILLAKIEQQKQEEEHAEYAGERSGQIGTGDRSEKIRTYNVLQDRVTDHRIKKSWHGIELILAGNIDHILSSLQSASDKMLNNSESEDGEEVVES